MSAARGIHLTGFVKPAGEYLAGWRQPGSPVAAGVDARFVIDLARRLEAARFDAIFIPDLVGVPDADPGVLERVAVVNDGFEPTTLLAALAVSTSRIGLVATASTSYSTPAGVADAFASLDRISRGRVGWNIVTSLNDAEARNFGLDAHLGHTDRYRRAEAFVDAVTDLWATPDATTEAAPLIRPVLAQAGSSGPGRALAARVGELIFTRTLPLEEARAFADDIRARAEKFGREPDELLVLPELPTVVAPTRAEAEDRFAAVRELLHPRVALADLEYWTGQRLADLPPDSPLPPVAEGTDNASRGAQAEIYRQARRDGLTIADLVRIVADGDGAVVGTPADVADHIEDFVAAGAADGFTVSFPWQPETLIDFTSLVVPELQRRGLFRTDYEGESLRDHLGLRRARTRA